MIIRSALFIILSDRGKHYSNLKTNKANFYKKFRKISFPSAANIKIIKKGNIIADFPPLFILYFLTFRLAGFFC